MRWSPIIFDLALVVAVWVAVLVTLRRARARLTPDLSSEEMRSRRLEAAAAISATVGFTWFVVWLASDAIGPHWVNALSMPATLTFIAGGAVLAAFTWAAGRSSQRRAVGAREQRGR
jgi:hypothetical protein